jgi:hypothetical protein
MEPGVGLSHASPGRSTGSRWDPGEDSLSTAIHPPAELDRRYSTLYSQHCKQTVYRLPKSCGGEGNLPLTGSGVGSVGRICLA